MKKLLFCTAALALVSIGHPARSADLRVAYKAPPAALPVLYSWTGFYIGGHIGGGWARNGVSDQNPFSATIGIPSSSEFNSSGFLGGGQAGYNYQFGRFVLGAEADISATDLTGSETNGPLIGPAAGGAQVVTDRTEWVATAAARFGLTFWDGRWLAYGKAGAAWAHNQYGENITVGGANAFSSSPAETRTGWTVGAGAEWAFAGNWSAKLEYDYLNFGNGTVIFSDPRIATPFPVQLDRQIQMVKLGLNYRFWGEQPALMARY